MSHFKLTCFFILICFSFYPASATWGLDWNIQTMRERNTSPPVFLKANTSISFKCESPLGKGFSGIIDIYSVEYDGFEACNATRGTLLGSIKCEGNHSREAEALVITAKEMKTHYFIGFARKKANLGPRVLLGGTCKSHKTKLMINVCDPVLTANGRACTMKERFTESSASSVCADESCPPYAKCNHTNTGNRCMCPSCSHTGRKVCGSDGKTYKDSCSLKKHSCKKNQHIKVKSHGVCAAVPRASFSSAKGLENKGKKSNSSLKTFYICMIFVGILGVAIALAMCIFQPLKSHQMSDRRQASDRHKDASFKRLHNKYEAEVIKREDI